MKCYPRGATDDNLLVRSAIEVAVVSVTELITDGTQREFVPLINATMLPVRVEQPSTSQPRNAGCRQQRNIDALIASPPRPGMDSRRCSASDRCETPPPRHFQAERNDRRRL